MAKNKEKPQKERKDPRISLNKLGEYLGATSTRRRTIVKDQKFPKEFIVVRYKKAREAIIQYFLKGEDEDIIVDLIEELENTVTDTNFKEQDRIGSIKLLDCFLELSESINTTDFKCERGFSKKAVLDIEGVEISVQPEIIIRGKKGKKKVVGAIKIATSKTVSLSEKATNGITTTLHQYIEEKVKRSGEIVDRNLCMLIDAFRKDLHTAPKSFKRRRKEIKNSCEEIRLWWGVV